MKTWIQDLKMKILLDSITTIETMYNMIMKTTRKEIVNNNINVEFEEE